MRILSMAGRINSLFSGRGIRFQYQLPSTASNWRNAGALILIALSCSCFGASFVLYRGYRGNDSPALISVGGAATDIGEVNWGRHHGSFALRNVVG